MLILASGSPRRRELLAQIGITYMVNPSSYEDHAPKKKEPEKQVQTLATGKACDVAAKYPGQWVLGADTIVAIDGKILGKPRNEKEAVSMLHELSNTKHTVYTGVALVKDDKIVFSNENQIYTKHDPTFHGEAGLIHEFCAETAITDLHEYTLYSSCEPCFMCSGAMVWVKLGRLVYGASNIDLEHILGNEGCNCSKIVFDNSFWHPQVTAGILREESLEILREYFDKHQKG